VIGGRDGPNRPTRSVRRKRVLEVVIGGFSEKELRIWAIWYRYRDYMNLDDRLKRLLKKKRIATIDELCVATDRAEITVKQALARLDYVTSYNHNSRFYALRSVCRFNRHGIWKQAKASFTKHGTLTALVVALVDDSRVGCTRGELDATTEVATGDVLRLLSKKGELTRLRWKGEFVYFTVRSKRKHASQMKARCGSASALVQHEEDVSIEELKRTIIILLEIMRSLPTTIRQLRETLQRTHPEIPESLVGEVCRRYSIKLKKKIDRHQLFELAVGLGRSLQEQTGNSYVFHFPPDQSRCPTCREPTEYYKTTKARIVKTLRYGDVSFRVSQVICSRHRCDPDDGTPLTYGSSFARSLGPPNSPIGFDVIAEIGDKRFLQSRQLKEIVKDLQDHGIALSASTVSRWADYFLAAVECLHFTRIQKLRVLIKHNGGYLLHIDATTETKSDTVFVCIDRVLGTVLLSEKISSENEEEVTKQLRRLKRYFGSPRAVMRDMSDCLGRAVQDVFPDVPDRICQFHLLRDIGKDLLREDYVQMGHRIVRLKINADLRRMKRELERQLPTAKVREAATLLSGISGIEDLPTAVVAKHEDVLALRLIVDVMDFTRDGDGLGFPFDLHRVNFFSRLNRLRLRLSRYCQRHPRIMSRCPHLRKLGEISGRISDADLRKRVKALRSNHRDFKSLRSVLRFEIKSKAPIATTMSIGSLQEIRAYNRGLVKYTKRLLRAEQRNSITAAEKVILKHLIRYQFKLPIPECLVELLDKLDRTNNFEESLFRDIKRRQRRQLGKKDISREFSQHGPYLPLMQNLRNDHYVAAMIGCKQDLPIRIGELDPADIAYYLQKLRERRRGKFFEYLKDISGIDLLPARD
jgi:hypothetical protein